MAAVNMRIWSRWLALLGIASGSAAATDVDLAKTGPGRAEAVAWQGRTLSQVLPVDAIDRIVLLKAVTSAPADLDLRNLRRMLPALPCRRPTMTSARFCNWVATTPSGKPSC
ncbi:hypothetical protein FB548_0952 [Pseudoxanthomonas sp. 3HH-4]|uniref:hypothetical protein n=1 Tax=Pseudoxanthomonas sp. 3HH-4 TaxID=1690214 RepID=UPI0011511A0A|nr:hypothetical protein [Pseudoxanthomonas sp. 3HH-4]TQM17567.1 hypothetical protein FB548_0952 [Pseudoxanthomonas sp. 3HH-4]